MKHPTVDLPLSTVTVVDDKRCNLPYAVRSICPKCSAQEYRDLSEDDYVSYPCLGSLGGPAPQPSKIYFTCQECEHEWTVRAILRVTMEILP